MQKLQFEASWDKALSAKDRSTIERIFIETHQKNHSDILCSPIQEAINHKEELLITVLIHNFTEDDLTFDNTRIIYSNELGILAKNEFTLPRLTIPSQVSMPWTFIFPKDSYVRGNSIFNGQLEIR